MMRRKIITACLALAALAAFILPASASATNNPLLTHPTGTAIASGTKITATNVGEAELLSTSGSTIILHCTTAKMTGKITSNTSGNVKGEIESASFTGTGAGGACTGIFNETVDTEGFPYCLRSDSTMATDEFQLIGGPCAGPARRITFKLTGTINCRYESASTIAAKGTFTTDTSPENSDAVLHVPRIGHTGPEDASFTLIEGGISCPSSGTLKMSFTLETDSATTEPIYIS